MPDAYSPWAIDLHEPAAAELINLERLAEQEPEVEAKLWEAETWIQALSDDLEAFQLSELADQVEWQERMERHGYPQPFQTCISCRYFNRDSRPTIVCALPLCDNMNETPDHF